MRVQIVKTLGVYPGKLDPDIDELTGGRWLYEVVTETNIPERLWGDQFYKNGTILDTPDEWWN